jgi:hypothetical protein
MSAAQQKATSLEQLQQTPEFAACTPKQRFWILSFIEANGDAVIATKLAYESKSDLNAQILSYKIRGQKDVVAALRLCYPNYGERDERKEFFNKLQGRLLKGKLTIADVEAVKMLCAERGWAVPNNLPSGRNGYVKVSQRVVPIGCAPIKKDGQVIGYYKSDDQRVDF